MILISFRIANSTTNEGKNHIFVYHVVPKTPRCNRSISIIKKVSVARKIPKCDNDSVDAHICAIASTHICIYKSMHAKIEPR